MNTLNSKLGKVQINHLIQGNANVAGTNRNVRNAHQELMRNAYTSNILVKCSETGEVKEFGFNSSKSGLTYSWVARFTNEELVKFSAELAASCLIKADVILVTINQDGSATLQATRSNPNKGFCLNITTQRFEIYEI
jgi:hypothetical protein